MKGGQSGPTIRYCIQQTEARPGQPRLTRVVCLLRAISESDLLMQISAGLAAVLQSCAPQTAAQAGSTRERFRTADSATTSSRSPQPWHGYQPRGGAFAGLSVLHPE